MLKKIGISLLLLSCSFIHAENIEQESENSLLSCEFCGGKKKNKDESEEALSCDFCGGKKKDKKDDSSLLSSRSVKKAQEETSLVSFLSCSKCE